MASINLNTYNDKRFRGKIPSDVGYNKSSNSLVFDSTQSQYLNRTPSITGNRKTWSLNYILKRTQLDDDIIFSAGSNDTNRFRIYFVDDTLYVLNTISSTNTILRQTDAVFRDLSAWYHILIVWDTTQTIANNRLRIYVNGIELTSFSTINNVSQNYDGHFNNIVPHYIGTSEIITTNTDANISKIDFIDGLALHANSFGDFNDFGVWISKPYNGSYGTNGFHLNFSNSFNFGIDTSKNNNHWTPVNFTSDSQVPDTWSDNYATFNPLVGIGNSTLSNSNLTATTSTTGAWTDSGAYSNISVSSGKWYCEFTVISNDADTMIGVISNETSKWYYSFTGNKYTFNTNNGSYGSSYTTNDIIGVALDLDNGNIRFYKNGTNQGIAYTELSGTFSFAVGDGSGGVSTSICSVNFGQKPFEYEPPAGFKTLSSTNLPLQPIPDGSEHFDIITYTGDGTDGRFIPTSFDPDFVWIKARSGAINNVIHDRVRGDDKALVPNLNLGEIAWTGYFSFVDGGISVSYNGSNGTANEWNASGVDYVLWYWKMGGEGIVNNDGSKSSIVSVNHQSGSSIVLFTGNTVVQTVGHGLQNTPKMIITKRLDTTGGWQTQFDVFNGTGAVALNGTNALVVNNTFWNDTPPDDTVFTTHNGSFMDTGTYMAYCFSDVEGYSKIGSFVGNGSTDGPFVWCGFRPRFIMFKRTDDVGNWYIRDSERNQFNPANLALYPNVTDAEFTGDDYDLLSNGFKIRNTGGNASGGTYVFAAFAENPFGGKGIYPVNAR